MRIIGVAVVCCLLAATAACGGDRTSYEKARASAQAMRLKAMLGHMEDLPQGFSDRVRVGWRPPFRPRDRNCRRLFDLAGGRPPRLGLSATTSVTYQGAHVGEMAGVGLAVYDGGKADDHLDEFEGDMERCVTAADAGAGAADRLSVSDLPLDDVGDGVEARRLTGRVGGYPYEMHLVVATSGPALITVVHTGLRTPDVQRTEELARLLARKVGNLDL
jgi:hypothetical protein